MMVGMGIESRSVDDFVRRHLPARNLLPDIINLDRFGYPDRLNCVSLLLDDAIIEGHGDRPCLRSSAISWTYAQTQEQVNRMANYLVNECGLRPGERVLLSGPNTPLVAACWLAIVKAGGVAVSTMALLRAGELVTIANKAQTRISLCDGSVANAHMTAQAQVPSWQILTVLGSADLDLALQAQSSTFNAVSTAADDVCLIAFTSGTTGNPKGCVHFHRDVMTICHTVGQDLLQASPDDVFVGSPPLAFTFGLGGLLLSPLFARASTVMLEKPSPPNLAAAIDGFGATVCFTAPTAYRAMLLSQGENDFGSLRKAISAGEALPRATYDLWLAATGLKLIDGIGSTELLHIFISASGDAIRPGATGRPVSGWEARIADDEGNTLPDGEVGNLMVRGPIGCRYLDDPRQANYVVDGWNRTGDKFIRDTDGYFWFQSRADDMIISAGYNIAAPEVEDAMLRHVAVAEVAVVGVPDDERGNIVKAFVVTVSGVSGSAELIQTLQDHVKQEIAPYKYPRAIEFVNELPKTNTGKIQRFKLRNR